VTRKGKAMVTTRTILLTGASGKIGRVLTLALLNEGHSVIGTTHRKESAERLMDDFAAFAKAGTFHAFDVDFSQQEVGPNIVDTLAAYGAFPDVVIHNARSQGALAIGPDNVTRRDAFIEELTLDVMAPYEMTMALVAVPQTRLNNIILISSIYGVVAANSHLYDDPASQSPIQYSVAKAAQIHLARELAIRLSGQGVRVNAVSFGGVEGRVSEAFKARYANLCPQGRMLDESEVIAPISYLLSEGASGMTGQNLIVDGGWTSW